jgi:ABC-type multidrug transport system fused ATPase/permease subunit
MASSWRLGLVVLIGVPLVLWLMTRLVRPLHRRQQRLRNQQQGLTTRGVDIVNGLRILRGLGGEDVFSDRYRSSSQRVRQARVEVARVEALSNGARVLLPGLLTATIVWVGANLVLSGDMSPGQLVAFYAYAVFLLIPLRWLTRSVDSLTLGYVAAERITAFLRLAAPPDPQEGELRPGVLAEPDSDVAITSGVFSAVVCETPEDAVVLADRLGGYGDTRATLDGVALTAVPRARLRRQILIEGHDSHLFAGPLGAELDPAGRDADVVERALDAASGRDIVEQLADGLDTEILPSGREFSGGQRQRLRLARALAADPEVLILLDPTSAVDAHTEARIAERVHRYRAGRTTVVLTTSSIVSAKADEVIYVRDGRVVARGSHDDLLTDPGYRSVVLRGEEAA